MNTLNLPSHPADTRVMTCEPAAVCVDGARRRDLELMSWNRRPAPDFDKAVLTLARNAADALPRLDDAGRLPAIGASISFRHPPESGQQFVGRVAAHGLLVEDGRELLTVECEHELATALSGKIDGLWQLSGTAVVAMPASRVRFNADHKTLAAAATVTIAGRQCRVFDGSLTSRPWTVADALSYLLATAVPAEVTVPSLEELDTLASEVDLGTLDATGRNIATLLAEIAARAGVELRAAREGLGLVAYRPGIDGRGRSVSLQPPGSKLNVSQSNLWRGQVRIRKRPSRPDILALGAPKRYEATFNMQSGWDTSLETSRWRDFVRSKSDHWPKLGDVYRKWVLNEHGWYAAAPWNLSVHSFATLSEADFTLVRPRRLLPCLSTDAQGRSLGVVVETRCGASAPWRRWREPLWTAENECAVYLGGDGLPGEFFQAAAAGEASVRVTAVVEADARLTTEIAGDVNATRIVADLSARAGWQQVHSSSVFAGSADVGAPAEINETDVLETLAAQQATAAAHATEAELTLGWVDTSFHVGDLVERIDGRQLGLSSHPDRRPVVCAVRHELGERQTTHLIVSG